MKKIKIFIELTRLNKPIGYMLLFWPCLWGLTLAFMQGTNLGKYFIYIIYFFLGSILMRSAGCITNDIVDKDFDKKVARTKNRPITSGKVSVKESFFYIVILCSLAFLILLQFNILTIILGISSMTLAFSYPFMKRLTYWPQLFLGITFNWGIIMAGSSILNTITPEIILLYIGAIFWTLGYDTIYGYQDIKDDEIIGVKSTSIKFKTNPKKFISLCYFLSICFFILLGLIGNYGINYYIFLILPIVHMSNQIFKLKIKDDLICLKVFKSNNFFGLLIFLTLIFK
jgi:4-hydroxybenzoate polyprenyl transferase